MASNTLKRYQCKWCNGAGFVLSGDKCWSCSGRGWYERSLSASTTIITALAAGLLSLGFWWLGRADIGWRIVAQGASASCLGVAVVSGAILLRGPEEKGSHGLMLLGTLLAAGGILSIPIRAIWKVLT